MTLFAKAEGGTGRPRSRRGACLLLSFFLPFLIFTLAVLALHVEPFGSHNLAISDGQYYINSLLFLKRLLTGQENILYSFNNGPGGNEWSQLAWGSPGLGGLLCVFATLETMPAWFTWISAVNMSLCGLTMYLLLAYLHGHRFSDLIFSTSYALMGFNVAYCYHYFFFIGPQMLPLMVLGLVKLLRGQSPLVYILSLAFCIFCNFYFGFMLCVASVILFLALYIVRRRETGTGGRRTVGLWVAASGIAGLLAAPMWLAAVKAYAGGGRINQTRLGDFGFWEKAPFLRIFSKLFSGANSQSEQVNGLPFIFCGILAVALVLLYFMDRGVPLRRRRAAGAVLGFYLLTFFVPALTTLMHGGTHTNWFPYRYSFVFSFLLLCLAAEEFQRLDELTLRDTKKCGAALLAGTVLVFGTTYEYVSGGAVVLDLALLALMWLGFYLYKTKPEKAPRRVLTLLLLVLVSGNLYANFLLSIYPMREWEKDLGEYWGNILSSGAIAEALYAADDNFFRMEKDESESGTIGADPALYNYNGVSHSGPSDRAFIHTGLNRLGINWYDMRHWYSKGIPAATDALLGLKYLVSQRDLTEEKGYELRLDANGTGIYQNPYALSVAILSDAAAADIELGDDPFVNLNAIWRRMTGGDKDVFTELEDVTFTLHNATAGQTVTSGELRTSVSAAADGESGEENTSAYIEVSFRAPADGPVYMFDTAIPASEDGQAVPCIKCCGVFRAGETGSDTFLIHGADYITGEMFRGYCANVVLARADNEALAEYAGALNSRDLTFDVIHENDLTGSFTAGEGQRLLFTIPWDEGWTCTIDGQPVPIDRTWDLFMSVEAPQGQHTYEMKFFPAWLDYGLILCGAALAALAVLMVLWVRHRGKEAAPAAAGRPEIPEAGTAPAGEIETTADTTPAGESETTAGIVPVSVDYPAGTEEEMP